MTDFTEIFLSTRKLIADVVSKIVPMAEVEDIVQDTYLRTHTVKNKEEIKAPQAYMVQIAKNLAYDHVKSAHYKNCNSLDDEVLDYLENLEQEFNTDSPWQNVATEKELVRICSEVNKLPEKCRKVFIMKKIYGYSQKEIAEKEGISVSTIEKHIAHGTKTLFNSMKDIMNTTNDFRKNSALTHSVVQEASND